MKLKHFWQISLFLLALTCGAGKNCKGQEAAFPYPEVPAVMTEPEERLAYLVEHFWVRYDFRDTALLQRREITEQGFADFVGLLSQAQDRALWQRAMKPFAEGAAETAEAYRCFGECSGVYEAAGAGRRGVCPAGVPTGFGVEEPGGAGGCGF